MRKQWAFHALVVASVVLSPAATRAEIEFAVVGAMSGPLAPIGSWFKSAASGAIEDINASGGLLGEQVDFIVRDDECNADKARSIAEDLAALKMPFVMGHLCSDASIAASEVYEKNGMIAISPASTNPALTDRGMSNIFRTTGRDDMQGFVLAEHILRNFKTQSLAILHDPTAYSRGVVDVAKNFLNQAGKEEVLFESTPEAPFDFSAIFDAIEEKKVQVVLYPAMPVQLAHFVKQREKRGLEFQLLGGDTFTDVVLEKKDIHLLDGLRFSFPRDPTLDWRNKSIVEKFKAKGVKPGVISFQSYAAVQVWVQAVREAGTLKAAEVSKVLRSKEFDTVLGRISFDEKGDISIPRFVIYIYNKGKKFCCPVN